MTPGYRRRRAPSTADRSRVEPWPAKKMRSSITAAAAAERSRVVPSKPLVSQGDLSLAYTPGVAEPCLEIARDPDASWEYTARGNLVAVISNGTAVLGLGDIGPAAGKPVMEGKACLFKKFADIDVFDLEVAEKDVDRLVDIIAALEPTFGGINLEDISAPACFDARGEAAGPRCRSRCSTTTNTAPRSSPAPACSTPPSSPARRCPTSGWWCPAPAPRRSPASTSSSRSASTLATSRCATPRACCTPAAPISIATRRGSRAPTTAAGPWPTRWSAPTCSWACRWPAWSRRRCSPPWARGRSSSRWPTPTPRSATPTRSRPAPTRWWRPDAPTIPTRSTTSSASRTSSAAPSTCGPGASPSR
jgi:hypothetical protein